MRAYGRAARSEHCVFVNGPVSTGLGFTRRAVVGCTAMEFGESSTFRSVQFRAVSLCFLQRLRSASDDGGDLFLCSVRLSPKYVELQLRKHYHSIYIVTVIFGGKQQGNENDEVNIRSV
jgi:hypothetical protein